MKQYTFLMEVSQAMYDKAADSTYKKMIKSGMSPSEAKSKLHKRFIKLDRKATDKMHAHDHQEMGHETKRSYEIRHKLSHNIPLNDAEKRHEKRGNQIWNNVCVRRITANKYR